MKKIITFFLYALVLVISGNYLVAKKGPTLERVTFLNNYGSAIACEFQWVHRYTKVERLQTMTIGTGKTVVKAPLLGYYLDRIIVTPSSMVAASVATGLVAVEVTNAMGYGGVGLSTIAMMVAWQGHIHAHKNRFFVISAGDYPPIPKEVTAPKILQQKFTRKADIAGYAHENAYQDFIKNQADKKNKN